MALTPEILYFDIRGRAEPIRLLLEELGVDYVDRQITPEQWATIRTTTPFRRMPVYSEGDLRIPESFAILRYLGRKHGLLGTDETSRIRCDVTVEAWRHYGERVAANLGALSHSAEARAAFLDTEQPALLADLEAHYVARGSTAPHWAGSSLTIADFAAFHLIEGLTQRSPEALQATAALRAFHAEFAARPNVARYLTSPRRPAAMFYGPDGKVFPTR